MQKKRPIRRIAITVSAMAVVLLLAASFRYVQARGLFASVEDKAPAVCHAVAGVDGVGDIARDKTGAAFIAANNGLYVYDGGKVERLAGTPKDFRPVALALGEDGAIATLFRQGDIWELSLFAMTAPTAVKEVGRMSADILTDPAALVALPAGRFYVVNKHGSHTALGRWLDDVFLLPRADVLYFDGMKFRPVAERLNSPAGLALAPDASHLYVTQELPRNLVALARNDFTGTVAEPSLLKLPAAPTKISQAKDGSLIVAAWPKKGAGAVYRVRLMNGMPQEAELLYASKTTPVTAAAELNGHLLIGSGAKLIDCKL
jgi:hypothetical protein